ncbi:MAG TPA: hypothetical protein LFW21_01285 [Rickettsia endosymbiont of Pyrocoelia pectoralis]|nr:hypothetical protein [Rickettsia endosymbiont of Pyrocoelia pectoralis]
MQQRLRSFAMTIVGAISESTQVKGNIEGFNTFPDISRKGIKQQDF